MTGGPSLKLLQDHRDRLVRVLGQHREQCLWCQNHYPCTLSRSFVTALKNADEDLSRAVGATTDRTEALSAARELVWIRDRHRFYCRACTPTVPCQLGVIYQQAATAADALATKEGTDNA